jgi:integrase
MARRINGEGTIYRRRDGRYEGAAYFRTTSGSRKRLRVYGRTREEVHERLTEAKASAQRGIPVPDKAQRLGEYLDYWLEHVVRPNRRPATYEQYAWIVRRFLKPGLGTAHLGQLSVSAVQRFLNQTFAQGYSAHRIRLIRMVLSAALTRAQREELVSRNVARLVEIPAYAAKERRPWSADEAKRFLEAARLDPLYPAFVLLMLYGLRRGEVLGLRWQDVDFQLHELRIRNQLQRVGGSLRQGPVKTRAGQRDLPLVTLASEVLTTQRAWQAGARARANEWHAHDGDQLVFTTRSGRPIDPDNFPRSFQRVCLQHDIRLIRVHDVRHTTATLLKNLGVPARDAQLILGHSHVSTTQQIYQHDDMSTRLEALGKVEKLFMRTVGNVSTRSRQFSRQAQVFVEQITSLTSGTPDRIRTYDLWYRNSINSTLYDRATEVNRLLNDCRRQWLIGIVAVNYCRQTPDSAWEGLA